VPRKKVGTTEISRLKVLAAGDERAFRECAEELLRSGDRMAREAALEALIQRPLPALRPALRELYLELDADGLKRDQGAPMRSSVVQLLKEFGDLRDIDIALRACDTHESAFGEDITWRLRVYGLRMLAEMDPEMFPFIAVEPLIPDEGRPRHEEEISTALQLLAAMGQLAIVYYWLSSGVRPPGVIAAVFGLLVSAKISAELYEYLAILLAGTARPPLLRLLERELRRGRRPKVVAAALQVRPTPESAKILKRWEEGEEYAD
jgi:hypothetical protein